MDSCCRVIAPCLYKLCTPLPPTTHSTDAIESPRYESFDDPDQHTTCCDKFFNLFTASASSTPDWSLRDSLLKDIDLPPDSHCLSIQELLSIAKISSSQIWNTTINGSQ